MSERIDHIRDEIARRGSNWLLQHVATRDYARKVDLIIKQGVLYAELDEGPYIGRKREH